MHLAIVEEVDNLLFSGICEQSNECTDVPKTLFKDGVLHFYYNEEVWLSNSFSENV